jgi:hypothetical protein
MVMSTDFIRSDFRAAFKQALAAAVEGTGLESRFLYATEPGTDECMPWLQQAGTDGHAGYWIACGLTEHQGLPAGTWPTYLWAAYLHPADPSDPDNCETLSERPVDLSLSGPAARDPRILAAITVTAVLGHQRDLAGRAS